MAVSHTLLKQRAIDYWRLRDAGDLSEKRTQAHNELLDALDALGITYADREDAAEIGRQLINGSEAYCVICEPDTWYALKMLIQAMTAPLLKAIRMSSKDMERSHV